MWCACAPECMYDFKWGFQTLALRHRHRIRCSVVQRCRCMPQRACLHASKVSFKRLDIHIDRGFESAKMWRAVLGRRLPALAAPALFARASTLCVSSEDIERGEHLKLLDAAKIARHYHPDMVTNSVGTVVEYCSAFGCKLVANPPDQPTITALLASLRSGSSLAGAQAWPDPGGSNAEKTRHATLVSAFTALGRLCRRGEDAALDRLAKAVGTISATASASHEETELKNAADRVERYELAASALYNVTFAVSSADAETIVKTRLAFEHNKLRVGKLGTGRYGRSGALISERRTYEEGADHKLKSIDVEEVATNRNALVLSLISECLDTLVVAGNIDLPPQAKIAGEHGKVNDAGKARQLQFDLSTARATLAAFVALSGQLSPSELRDKWEVDFVRTAHDQMCAGHSGCSAFRYVLSLGWMLPGYAASVTPAVVPRTAGVTAEVARAPARETASPFSGLRFGKKGVVVDDSHEPKFVTYEQYQKKQKWYDEQLEVANKRARVARGPRVPPSYGDRRDDRRVSVSDDRRR